METSRGRGSTVGGSRGIVGFRRSSLLTMASPEEARTRGTAVPAFAACHCRGCQGLTSGPVQRLSRTFRSTR